MPDEPAGTAGTTAPSETTEAPSGGAAATAPPAGGADGRDARVGEPWTYTPPPGVEPQGLLLVIYASERDKADAEAEREEYQGRYGDAAPTLSVEPSSHYEGLEPGYWVVISAYLERTDAESDLDWAKLHDIPGYVKQANKLCDDDIDVFCGS